jgi:hypothetical protein
MNLDFVLVLDLGSWFLILFNKILVQTIHPSP